MKFTRGLVTTIRPLVQSAYSLAARSPFTLQAGLLGIFSCYLLLGPVPASSDIISAALAYGLLTLAGLISGAAILHGLRVKKTLSVGIAPPEGEVHPGRDVLCILRVSPVTLLPGVFLECSVEFAHPGSTPSIVRLFGSSSEQRRVPITLSFPHRGNWDVKAIQCCLGDTTGFVRLRWAVPMQSSIIVTPEIPINTDLPLISSTQRPDDSNPDTVHRYGDPFDIKPYHPADGIKKIVWKAFAKSGELLSRHPEPAMTPEGFVAVCVLARPLDDDLCGRALAYVAALKELKLDILVGCEGHGDREPGRDAHSSKTLLVDSVWDAAQSNHASLVTDIQAIIDESSQGSAHTNLRSLVLFCSGSRLTDKAESAAMIHLAQWLSAQAIEPVFFLTEPQMSHNGPVSPLRKRAQALLIEPHQPHARGASLEQYQQFLSTCLAQQWRVFV
jgi:hypothetical protein